MSTLSPPDLRIWRWPWNADAGYRQLAYDSVLPLFTALHAGDHDAEALLAAAFSPLVHGVLEQTLEAGALGLYGFLRQLARPPRPESVTRFVTPGTAWTRCAQRGPEEVLAAFDLRPGGGPELEDFPYVALLDEHGRIPIFHQELLPLVVAVLRGWGATLLILPPPRTDLVRVQAQWSALSQPPTTGGLA